MEYTNSINGIQVQSKRVFPSRGTESDGVVPKFRRTLGHCRSTRPARNSFSPVPGPDGILFLIPTSTSVSRSVLMENLDPDLISPSPPSRTWSSEETEQSCWGRTRCDYSTCWRHSIISWQNWFIVSQDIYCWRQAPLLGSIQKTEAKTKQDFFLPLKKVINAIGQRLCSNRERGTSKVW